MQQTILGKDRDEALVGGEVIAAGPWAPGADKMDGRQVHDVNVWSRSRKSYLMG